MFFGFFFFHFCGYELVSSTVSVWKIQNQRYMSACDVTIKVQLCSTLFFVLKGKKFDVKFVDLGVNFQYKAVFF